MDAVLPFRRFRVRPEVAPEQSVEFGLQIVLPNGNNSLVLENSLPD